MAQLVSRPLAVADFEACDVARRMPPIMRTVRFVVTGAPFDITAARRPRDPGSRIWVIVEDAGDRPAFAPAVGWLEVPEALEGREDELARALDVEVAMRVQMGPERDRVEALAAMLDGDAVTCSAACALPIRFDSPSVPRRIRELAAPGDERSAPAHEGS